MGKRKKQFKFEEQLHEQYAINKNANIGSFVSFMGALMALFGFFGYVFVYSTNKFSIDGKYVDNGIMTIDVFLLFSVIVSGMLFFLSIISLQLGYSGRRDQIIIDRIRNKYYKSKKAPYLNSKNEIFGNSYNPLNKSFSGFVQDYFNLFYWLFFVGQIIVFLLTLYKICNMNCTLDHDFYKIILIIIIIYILVVLPLLALFCRCHYFSKYCYIFKKKKTKKLKKELEEISEILSDKLSDKLSKKLNLTEKGKDEVNNQMDEKQNENNIPPNSTNSPIGEKEQS